jgi:predicted PurR-regulated permease PerM
MDAMRPNHSNSRFERQAAAILLLLLAAGCVWVLRPFLSALLWAAILVSSTWPIHARLERLLGGRRTLGAALMVATAAALFLLPLVAMGSRLAAEVPQIAALVSKWMENGPPQPPSWVVTLPVVGERLDTYWQSIDADGAKLTADLERYVEPAKSWLLGTGMMLVAGMADMMLSLAIAFFFYRDGMAPAGALRSALGRVGGGRAEHLLVVAAGTIRGVVYGIVGTNLTEASLAALGLWLAGVPGAVLLGFALFFLTLVPMAPLLVFAPAILWLMQQGATTSAILLAAWYVLVFMVIEGVLRSYLISRGGELPFLLVLLGMLGGVFTFGFLGIFLGPTLLAVAYAVLHEWNAAEAGMQPEMAVAPSARPDRAGSLTDP